jgi:hypothetical protein
MANQNPPKKNQQFIYGFWVQSASDNTSFITPTFAAGDCLLSKDGAAFANTTNLPTHIANGYHELTLTATETNCDRWGLLIRDQSSPVVWTDHGIFVCTTA